MIAKCLQKIVDALVCILALGMLSVSCMHEVDSSIRAKFDFLVDSDFKSLVNELPKASISDSAHFVIAEYLKPKHGMFRAHAIVDYYYLKNIRVKRTVKYRYGQNVDKWERYSNTYVFY